MTSNKVNYECHMAVTGFLYSCPYVVHCVTFCRVDDTADLLHMLEQLSPLERSGQVHGWECGGSVFLDYLRIGQKFQELSSSESQPSDYDLESLHMVLKQLAVRIGRLPDDSPRKV